MQIYSVEDNTPFLCKQAVDENTKWSNIVLNLFAKNMLENAPSLGEKQRAPKGISSEPTNFAVRSGPWVGPRTAKRAWTGVVRMGRVVRLAGQPFFRPRQNWPTLLAPIDPLFGLRNFKKWQG
jgi:hypothetical protein